MVIDSKQKMIPSQFLKLNFSENITTESMVEKMSIPELLIGNTTELCSPPEFKAFIKK